MLEPTTVQQDCQCSVGDSSGSTVYLAHGGHQGIPVRHFEVSSKDLSDPIVWIVSVAGLALEACELGSADTWESYSGIYGCNKEQTNESVQEAREDVDQNGTIPWDQLRTDLGL